MNEFSTKLITAITKHWVICKERKKNKQVSLQLMQSQESRQKWLTNVQKHTTLSLQQKILRFTQFVCWQLIYFKIDVNVISLSYVRKILLSSRRPQIQE